MASALTIPGVQVRTQFEPAPVAAGVTGILGVVGITDQGPTQPTPVGTFTEFLEAFGPGSRYTMPEVRTALTNGVSQVVIARTAPGRGTKAAATLKDSEGEQVVKLRARAEGAWGKRVSVRVVPVTTLSGEGVKYVNLRVLLDGEVVDVLDNLVMDPTSPNDLFTRINAQSRLVTATDPAFDTDLPKPIDQTSLADSVARAAFAVLDASSTHVVRADAARAGRAGNHIAVKVAESRAGLALTGAGDAPSIDVTALKPGAAGTDIRIAVQSAADPNDANALNLVVAPKDAPQRTVGPFSTPQRLQELLSSDPDLRGVAAPAGAPQPSLLGPTALKPRVNIEVFAEGRDRQVHADIRDVTAIPAIKDSLVKFSLVGTPTQLPDPNPGLPLEGGRDKGAALALVGPNSDEPLLELVPAPGVTSSLAVKVTGGISSIDRASAVSNLAVFADDKLTETFTDLTMDPDDTRYLPETLHSSHLLRGLDLFIPSHTTSLPVAGTFPLDSGGDSPTADDYQDALDRLESAEEVDLVIASVANQLDDGAVRTVHQQVVAHCTKMADLARNRIGIGSVTRSESGTVEVILDHADDVRSDHFILTTPAGSDGAVAGLLGLQDYFQSPTFKTISALGVPPGHYTDTELVRLINGNVVAINERRGLGVIVVKGLLTSGRQINVQRTANKAVRDVKAISQRYIGLLNNDGTRNALKQQVFAMLLQMERDGALVPSGDGTSPAFSVDVGHTQADIANGIVRVDIAIRPVRAVDFVYATILVQN
jgi:hypothetical protein